MIVVYQTPRGRRLSDIADLLAAACEREDVSTGKDGCNMGKAFEKKDRNDHEDE